VLTRAWIVNTTSFYFSMIHFSIIPHLLLGFPSGTDITYNTQQKFQKNASWKLCFVTCVIGSGMKHELLQPNKCYITPRDAQRVKATVEALASSAC
jgi:hypothetical protein